MRNNAPAASDRSVVPSRIRKTYLLASALLHRYTGAGLDERGLGDAREGQLRLFEFSVEASDGDGEVGG